MNFLQKNANAMQIKLKLLFPLLISIVFLSGCAYTTDGEIVSAEKYLTGNCKEAFLSSRTAASSDGFGYQYHRYRVRAFAVANYGNSQEYSWWHGPWGTPQSQANKMALNGCNQKLPSGMTCAIFAEDDRIVGIPPNYQSRNLAQNNDGTATRLPAYETILNEQFCEREHNGNLGLEYKLCLQSVKKAGSIDAYKQRIKQVEATVNTGLPLKAEIVRKPIAAPINDAKTSADNLTSTPQLIPAKTPIDKRIALVIGNSSY